MHLKIHLLLTNQFCGNPLFYVINFNYVNVTDILYFDISMSKQAVIKWYYDGNFNYTIAQPCGPTQPNQRLQYT